MIRLKDLLAEISLGSVTPYATSFTWRDNWGDGESWEAKFEAVEGGEDEPQRISSIMMTMTLWKSSKFSDSGEWQFAYFVRTNDDNGWTTTSKYSAASGDVNPFRLFKTLGEAIRDFAESREGVDVNDITGSDTYDAKGAQKTRIYADFLRTNPGLNQFDVVPTGRGLYLVRKGVEKTDDTDDVDDFYRPDGSDSDVNSDWRADPDGSESTSF